MGTGGNGSRRRRGVALLLVLVLVASATVLGVVYAISSTVRLTSADNLVKAGRARGLAESGIEHGRYLLSTDPTALAGSDVTLLGPYSADNSGDTYYFGSAAVPGPAGQFLLTGRAMVGGVTQSVSLRLHVESNHSALMTALNPVHYWRLGEPDDTGDAVDRAGDWEGQYWGPSPGWSGAIVHDADTATRFDGNDDRVYLGPQDMPGQVFTIMAWVCPTRHDHLLGRDARIIAKATDVTPIGTCWLIRTGAVGAGTRLVFALSTHADQALADLGFGTTSAVTSSEDIPLNKWALVTATYDGVLMRIYQDGQLAGQIPKTGFITKRLAVNVWIGGSPSNRKDRPWEGKIDEVAIFDRVLTPEQIKELHAARLPTVRKLAWDE